MQKWCVERAGRKTAALLMAIRKQREKERARREVNLPGPAPGTRPHLLKHIHL